MLPQQLIPLSRGLGLLAFLRHRAGGDGTIEPVWFSPSALGQELAALPCGGPIWLQRALAGGDHGGEGWLQAGTWLQFLAQPRSLHGLLSTHHHANLPCHVWAMDLLGM